MRALVILAAGLVLLGMTIAGTARAYVLPADFVLRTLMEKRRALAVRDMSMQLSTELTAAGGHVEERLYLKNPERWRRVRQEEYVATVYVQREKDSAQGAEGEVKRVQGAPSELLPWLLMPKGNDVDQMVQRLLEVLKAWGVDTSVVSIGRFDGKPAYVIGSQATDADKPQLWLDKETWLPLRFLSKQQRDGKPSQLETRWLEFNSSTTGEWFPRTIEILQDGRRLERTEVINLEINKKVPEAMFDIPAG